MDTNAIAALATDMARSQVALQVDTLMLRKALDIAASNALTLLAALPAPASVNPPHLGNAIDVRV